MMVNRQNMRQTAQPESKGKMLLFALGFLAVGIGLFLCIPLGQTDGDMEYAMAIVGGIVSVVMGVRYVIRYLRA